MSSTLPLEITHQTDVAHEEWDSLTISSEDTWLWHSWLWIEAVARVYSVEKHYFICSMDGRTVGGLPLLLRRSERRGRAAKSSLTPIPAGPFCVSGLNTKTREQILAGLTRAVASWASTVGLSFLSCMLPPLAKSNLENAHGVNPLAAAGWLDTSTHTLIADLSRSESELWSDFAHDARWHVNKARKSGYVVERASWREMLDSYYRVHVENYERTGVPPHPRTYFEAIAESEERHQTLLWVGRDPSGRPVAFHNCARFRDGSVYNTGCCETEHLRSGVNYMLFWNAIMGAKVDGCNFYEIGEVFLNAKDAKLRGLTTFKRKFGGELYRFYRGEIPVTGPRYLRLAGRLLPGSLRRRAARHMRRLCRSFLVE